MEFNIFNDEMRKVICVRNDSNLMGGGTFAHLLTIGETYTIDYVDVGDWSTMVGLKEFPGKEFNSVLFEEIDTTQVASNESSVDDIKRGFALLICDCFETLLDEHNIKIPNEDRTGDGDEACIYGSDWGDLVDHVTDYLGQFQEASKKGEK